MNYPNLYIRFLSALTIFLTIFFCACNHPKEDSGSPDASDLSKKASALISQAEAARSVGKEDEAITLYEKCLRPSSESIDILSGTIAAEALNQIYNTFQSTEKWHEGALWFDSVSRYPSPFIASHCMRDLKVFTAMSFSRDNRDSIAEAMIEEALHLPANHYNPWKYFRDYAYASAILYANLQKTEHTIAYAQSALKYAKICEQQNGGAPQGKSYVSSMLGNLYKRSGRLKEGVDLIRDGIANAIELKDTLAQINGYNALTELMLYWSLNTQAEEYSNKAMALLEGYYGLVEDPLVAATSYAYRGRVKSAIKADSAMCYWKKAEEISSKMPYTFGMDELDLLISEYNMSRGQNINEAKRRLLRVVKFAAPENAAKAYHLLAKISANEGDEGTSALYLDSMLTQSRSSYRKIPIPGGNALGLRLALKNNDTEKIRLFSNAFLDEYNDAIDPLNTRQLTEIVAHHYLSEKNIEVAMERNKMKSRFMMTILILAGSTLITILLVISLLYRSRLAKTRELLLEQRLNALLSSNSDIMTKLATEKERNDIMKSRLDMIVSDPAQRQKLGAEAISKVKTSDGLSDFMVRFNVLYPSFLVNLKKMVPEIGKREELMCMLMALGCDTGQISNLMCVAPKSVNMARWRLRKKIGLTSEQSLDELVESLANEASVSTD